MEGNKASFRLVITHADVMVQDHELFPSVPLSVTPDVEIAQQINSTN